MLCNSGFAGPIIIGGIVMNSMDGPAEEDAAAREAAVSVAMVVPTSGNSGAGGALRPGLSDEESSDEAELEELGALCCSPGRPGRARPDRAGPGRPGRAGPAGPGRAGPRPAATGRVGRAERAGPSRPGRAGVRFGPTLPGPAPTFCLKTRGALPPLRGQCLRSPGSMPPVAAANASRPWAPINGRADLVEDPPGLEHCLRDALLPVRVLLFCLLRWTYII